MKEGYVYCPVCGKMLEAVNIEDVENGEGISCRVVRWIYQHRHVEEGA